MVMSILAWCRGAFGTSCVMPYGTDAAFRLVLEISDRNTVCFSSTLSLIDSASIRRFQARGLSKKNSIIMGSIIFGALLGLRAKGD